MVKAERAPDASLYAVVMRACALRGRYDDAMRLLEQMKAAGLAVDQSHIAALLLACERRGDGDARSALQVLQMMPDFGLQPTTLTFNMAMGSCAKRGDIEQAEQLLAQMDSAPEDARPNIVTLNTMLDTYKRADKWEACLEFLLKMEVRRRAPETRAAPRAASSRVAPLAHRARRARAPLRRPQSERQVQPDVVSVNTAIKACKDNGQFELALQLFEGMAGRGLEPDSVSFTEIIAACGRAGEWARAIAVFRAAEASADGVNTFVWNALVGAAVACDKSVEALETIKEMRSSGIAPDIVTFTTVMTMLSKKEEWEAVLFVAEELEATGLQLSRPLVNQVQRAGQALLGKERREASV